VTARPLRPPRRTAVGAAPRRSVRRPSVRPRPAPIALTGTPGVGKSSVARRLASRWSVIEVSDLARRWGASRRSAGGVEVDVRRLRAGLRRPGAWDGVDVVVGHLAHLLPVRAAIVLRCHPRELVRRLVRAGRGSADDRAANYVSEALDLVLAEAVGARLPVDEVDTTGRSIRAVAAEVDARLRGRGRRRRPAADWLADRSVTAHLLDGVG
jgi:adenylate kinase